MHQCQSFLFRVTVGLGGELKYYILRPNNHCTITWLIHNRINNLLVYQPNTTVSASGGIPYLVHYSKHELGINLYILLTPVTIVFIHFQQSHIDYIPLGLVANYVNGRLNTRTQ